MQLLVQSPEKFSSVIWNLSKKTCMKIVTLLSFLKNSKNFKTLKKFE